MKRVGEISQHHTVGGRGTDIMSGGLSGVRTN